MRHNDTVTLFVPVDREGFDIVWRKYVIKNVTLSVERSGDGDEGTLYLFYDKARFYRGGKKVTPFKIRVGCAVMRGADEATEEQFVIGLPPKRMLRVCEAEHFVSGSLRVRHTKLSLR